uniref:hypothetical protein n=1 Tax=uncultured Aliiroseovarius sp. TaxID=1658783 RepID=UPI0026144D04
MTFITRLFPDFDTALTLREKSLARELDLVARARADGTRNHPDTAETEPTEFEIKVLTRGQHAIDEVAQWFKKRVAERTKTSNALLPTPAERDTDAQVSEAGFALAKLRDENRDSITALAESDAAALMELRKFRRDNDLTREATYAKSPILVMGLGAVLLLAESILNAQTFADVSDYGLIGGWLTAATYSVGNLFLGFFVTGLFGLRHAIHVRPVPRILGLLATLTGSAATLGYNAYLGTVRAAIDADPDGAAYRQAFARLIEEPTGFMNTPSAALLFAIGMGFALAFAAKGFLVFDPYPGYRKVHRRHVAARRALDAARIRFRNAAKALVDTRIKTIEDNLTAAEARNRKILDMINQTEIDATAAETSAVDSAAVCQRLIATWRTENAAIRTAAAPAYFRTLPSLDAELRGLPKINFTAHRDVRNADMEALRVNAKAAQATLRDMAMNALDTVTAEIKAAEKEGTKRAENEENITF